MKLFSYSILSLLLGTAVTLSILTGCHNKDSFEPVVIITASSDISSSSNVEALEQKPAPQLKTESKPESIPESKPQLEGDSAPESKTEANTELELWKMDYDTYFSQEREFIIWGDDINAPQDDENLMMDENKIIDGNTKQVVYEADQPISRLCSNRELLFFVKGTDTKTVCRVHRQSGRLDELFTITGDLFAFKPTSNYLIEWSVNTPEWIAYTESGGDLKHLPEDLIQDEHYVFNSKTGEQKFVPESEWEPYHGKFKGVPHNSEGIPILGEDLVFE